MINGIIYKAKQPAVKKSLFRIHLPLQDIEQNELSLRCEDGIGFLLGGNPFVN